MAGLKLYACAAVAWLAAAPALAAGNEVNDAAPAYTVLTFDKQKVSSDELKGKVVVLNYWATWCAPCRREMIAMDRYIRTHPNTDLKVYAITVESSVPPQKLKPLSEALSFPLARKLSGRGYGVKKGVPTSYVIDRSGTIRHAEAGAFDEASFAAVVEPLLKQPAP